MEFWPLVAPVEQGTSIFEKFERNPEKSLRPYPAYVGTVTCSGAGESRSPVAVSWRQISKGARANFLFSLEDRSEAELLETDLFTLTKRLVAESIASSLSHDINNVMAGISGANSMLKRGLTENPSALSRAELIDKCVDRLGTISKTLSALGGKRLPPQQFSVKALCLDVQQIIQRHSHHGVQTSVDIEGADGESGGSDDLLVHGKREALRLVLLLLDENAREAGATSIKIRVRKLSPESLDYPGLATSPYASIVIEDNGRGIALPEGSTVPEPFFSTKSNHQGLGLSYAQNVVKSFGGVMMVSRKESGGTTVFLALPMVEND